MVVGKIGQTGGVIELVDGETGDGGAGEVDGGGDGECSDGGGVGDDTTPGGKETGKSTAG